MHNPDDKNFSIVTVLFTLSLCAVSCGLLSATTPAEEGSYQERRAAIVTIFGNQTPRKWGEFVPGVKKSLQTDQKVIALTLDACGGGQWGSGFDKKLIDYLIAHQIPATLFINARWIDKNPELFQQLAANPLFEIENHGALHKPLSVTGATAYGATGTLNAGEVFDEIEQNALKIEQLTGKKPRFFRSGTAYYDEVAVQIANALGYEIVNFSVLGDAGATYSKEQVKNALLTATSGSIVIAHMNQPIAHGTVRGETADGIIAALPELQKRGFLFVTLSAFPLK